jgi:hypothetical protein
MPAGHSPCHSEERSDEESLARQRRDPSLRSEPALNEVKG